MALPLEPATGDFSLAARTIEGFYHRAKILAQALPKDTFVAVDKINDFLYGSIDLEELRKHCFSRVLINPNGTWSFYTP